ncbi:hypothetical protein FOA43_003360 [Brettanomyces nanus]|uniref:Amino acid permease/ SLC12A domain-containing protein n=1 Tax=Eeniella nana TaxID=13502 RepID=A0A875SAG3_EENNA|nr:uncharacterized protein FOA43_003360 [Brettanomyces nanus]QPG75974.1 hypothetical protein FOA43_003360 [Brettanomyces nanus]
MPPIGNKHISVRADNSETSVLNNAQSRRQSHSTQALNFDLFPQIIIPNSRDTRSGPERYPHENSNYKNAPFDSSGECIDDEEQDSQSDGKISGYSSYERREVLEGSSNDNKEDLQSSILNKILDEDLGNKGTELDDSRSKFHYKNLYDKYREPSMADTPSVATTDLTDFEKYNLQMAKEQKIRDRLRQMKGLRVADRGHVKYLPTLGIGDLDSGYIKPIYAQIEKPPSATKRSQAAYWYQRMFRKGGRRETAAVTATNTVEKYYSSGSSSHNIGNPTYDLSVRNGSTGNGKMFDRSSVCTAPIDDDIDLDGSPVELQTYCNLKSTNFKSRSYHAPSLTSVNGDDSIDMIVSNQENVDYNFQLIDSDDTEKDYLRRVTVRNGDGHRPFANVRSDEFSIKDTLRRVNPVRIMREQKNQRYRIQRKLKLRHLHQIALGGTLGVGLLLSSGKAFSIAGPLGCLLGFIIAGLIVLATMLSFCEMVTLIPLCGGVSGVSSRFVDDAFGFALGVGYWLCYMVGLPTEITAASIMLSFYKSLDIPGPNTCGWIAFFLIFATCMNLCDIRVYGEFEYFSTIIKLLIIIALMIYMIVLDCGGSAPLHHRMGFRYWDSSKSDWANSITFGAFRPTFDVNDIGLGSLDGIGGAKGRICQVLIATVVASYAYVGTEIVIIAGSEARDPRKAIPSATRNIYWRIFIFYISSIFAVGLNIYSGDPRLLRYFSSSATNGSGYLANNNSIDKVISLVGGDLCETNLLTWAGFSNGNQSPFVIAIQSSGMCTFAAVTNAFLLYFAVTAATSQLYAASRTLYFLSIQGKAPQLFSICSKNGVPYLSVLFTAAFGCLAFLSVNNNTALVFERLLSICASSGLIVWSGMCLSFIRFYYGLKLRPDIINRDDENYPYKSPFQPFLAYFGMISSFFTVIISGFLVFLKAKWSPMHFISCYGSLFVFIFCYITYKIFRRTKIHRLDQLDLDSGRREIDRIIWEDEQNYVSNFKEIIHRFINFLL